MFGKPELDLDKNYTAIQGGLMDIGILGTSFLTILFSILFFLISIFLIFKMSQLKIIDLKRSIIIFTFHSIISMIFISVLMALVVNDLDSYFQTGLFLPDEGFEERYNFRHWGILTLSVFYRILYLYFQLDFLSINILFACVGSFVLIFFDKLIRNNVKIDRSRKNIINYLFYFLVFFPSFSIWTSTLGKEILTILLLLIFAYVLINEKKIVNKLIIFLPIIILITLIRPHFTFFIVVSLIFYFTFILVKNNSIRFIIFLISSTLFLILGSLYLDSLSLNIFALIDLFFEAGLQQRKNLSSEYQIREMPTNIFQLYFSFLFSPIFSFGSMRDIFLSFENLALVVVMIILIFNIDLEKFKKNDESKFFFAFFLISTFVLSIFTYQSGVYWRMKWLVLPYFFIGISLIQKDSLINDKK